MLSIPGFRGLMKTKDAGRDQRGEFAEFFDREGQQSFDTPSYLLYLAKRLEIGLLALVEVDPSGKRADITAAGREGITSKLAVPKLESGGPMGGLIAGAQPGAGKARIFTKQEVFPEDGTWCDFVPMDSVVAYVFVPVSSLPLPESAGGVAAASNGRFLLAAEDPGSEAEQGLPLKVMLSAGLVGLSQALKGREQDRTVLQVLKSLLKQEGYSIGFAGNSGDITERDGNGFEAIKGEVMERLRQELASLDAQADACAGPKDLATPELENLKVSAYALGSQETGPSRMVVVKQYDVASQIRNRRERLKLLSRFISSIAHEIKNPLTGISAGVQYLAKKIQPGIKEDETVEFILSEINRLNRIVDDLYKAAKPPQLQIARVNLNEVVGRSLISMSENVTGKRLTVSQALDEAVPEIDADADRLQQVLINIIKNAIEASPEGGTLSIETFIADSMACVRVSDQGPGLDPEERERIFEPFYSTKDRGSGLGLCISQRIVDEHGGNIRVEAPESGGTAFVIELPAGR